MAPLSNPHVFVEIYLYKYPASLGIQTVRLTTGQRPISLPGAFYQPRIKSIGDIKRSCTDQDGNYSVSFCDVVIADQDFFLANLLISGADTEYFYAREAAVWVISQEGLHGGLTPATCTTIHRGWISAANRNGRDVTIRIADVIGSQMSGFNLDKKVLTTKVKDLTTAYREENKNVSIPKYVGEFNDDGAPPVNGVAVQKGIIPCIEVGLVDPATGQPPTAPAGPITPPVITANGQIGAAGQVTLYYAASTITQFGESALSNIVGISGASVRSLSDYNWLQGTFDIGGADGAATNKVRIWVSDSASPTSFHQFLDEADYPVGTTGVFVYGDGAKVTDVGGGGAINDELDVRKEYSLTPSNAIDWSIMAICDGYDYGILKLYASNLAEGTAPKRQLVQPSEHGSYFVFPTDAEWPFPNPWLDLNGHRITGFLARGPKLQAHRDGTVTMAACICGPHGPNGKVINQAFRALLFFLNEHCVKNKGTGYTNDDYFTLETFANGDAMLATTKFEQAQTDSISYVGGLGYLTSIWVTDENTTWRQFITTFCVTFGCRIGVNKFGQVFPFMVPAIYDTVLGRHFRERIEIKHSEEAVMDYEQIVNKYNINYFYDPDTGRYRGQNIPVQNLTSIAAHVPGGVIGSTDMRGLKQQDRTLSFTADAATATDVGVRELLRRQRRPRYPHITTPMLGLMADVGDRCRITEGQSGLGPSGDVALRTIVLEHTFHIFDQEVTLQFQSVDDIIGYLTGPFFTTGAVGDNVGPPITSFAVGDNVGPPITSREVA